MPFYSRKRRYGRSYPVYRVGAYPRKAAPYFRARRTIGKRIGAGTSNTYQPRSASARASGHDVTSASAVIPRPISSQDRQFTQSFATAVLNDGSGTTAITPVIVTGGGETNRQGNQITLRYIDLCYSLEPAITTLTPTEGENWFNNVRFMLVLDRFTNGLAPGLAAYKTNNSDPIHAGWDADYVPSALVPLVDNVHTLDRNNRCTTYRKRVMLTGIRTTYNGVNGLVSESIGNHLFFLFTASYNDATTLKNRIQARFTYTLVFTE